MTAMPARQDLPGEIESFNLADLDVSALDVRLELTNLLPHGIIICPSNCSVNCVCHGVDGCNVYCHGNTGCGCNALD
jgi:hypothetical protein